MSDSKVSQAAEFLAACWREHRQVPGLPAEIRPASRSEAYAVQDELARVLGFEVAGWKVGVGSRAALRDSGVDEPIPGRLFVQTLAQSPATFPGSSFSSPMLESEFAFRLLDDLPARSEPYSREEVSAVATLHLAIEIGDFRVGGILEPLIDVFASPGSTVGNRLDPLSWIADNGGGGAFVMGPEISDWRDLDLETHPIELWVNGNLASSALVGEARVDPIGILQWTVNHVSQRNLGIAAGAFVTTGTATTPAPIEAGDEAVALFEGLGEVRVAFSE